MPSLKFVSHVHYFLQIYEYNCEFVKYELQFLEPGPIYSEPNSCLTTYYLSIVSKLTRNIMTITIFPRIHLKSHQANHEITDGMFHFYNLKRTTSNLCLIYLDLALLT